MGGGWGASECKKGGSAGSPTFAPIYLPSQITVSNLSDDEEEVLSSHPSPVPRVMVSSMRPLLCGLPVPPLYAA